MTVFNLFISIFLLSSFLFVLPFTKLFFSFRGLIFFFFIFLLLFIPAHITVLLFKRLSVFLLVYLSFHSFFPLPSLALFFFMSFFPPFLLVLAHITVLLLPPFSPLFIIFLSFHLFFPLLKLALLFFHVTLFLCSYFPCSFHDLIGCTFLLSFFSCSFLSYCFFFPFRGFPCCCLHVIFPSVLIFPCSYHHFIVSTFFSVFSHVFFVLLIFSLSEASSVVFPRSFSLRSYSSCLISQSYCFHLFLSSYVFFVLLIFSLSEVCPVVFFMFFSLCSYFSLLISPFSCSSLYLIIFVLSFSLVIYPSIDFVFVSEACPPFFLPLLLPLFFFLADVTVSWLHPFSLLFYLFICP